jgi:hypothetical protein
MGITEVSGQKSSSPVRDDNVASSTLAFPNPVTAGNLIVFAGAVWNDAAVASVTVTKSAGGATLVSPGIIAVAGELTPTVTDNFPWLAYGIVETGGTLTLQVAPSTTSGNYINAQVDEFTGVDPTPLDATGSETTGEGSSGPATGTITTATAGALIVGVLCLYGGAVINVGSGYTQLDEDETQNRVAYNSQWSLAGAAGSYNVDWTGWSGATRGWSLISLAFKELATTPPLPADAVPARPLRSTMRW